MRLVGGNGPDRRELVASPVCVSAVLYMAILAERKCRKLPDSHPVPFLSTHGCATALRYRLPRRLHNPGSYYSSPQTR